MIKYLNFWERIVLRKIIARCGGNGVRKTRKKRGIEAAIWYLDRCSCLFKQGKIEMLEVI